MQSHIHLKIADPTDIEGMIELQKQVYPEYGRDRPFFTWQYFDNPNPVTLVVAKKADSIVGTFGIQQIDTTNNLRGGQIGWLVIAESQRRTGFSDYGPYGLRDYA